MVLRGAPSKGYRQRRGDVRVGCGSGARQLLMEGTEEPRQLIVLTFPSHLVIGKKGRDKGRAGGEKARKERTAEERGGEVVSTWPVK